MHSMTMSGTCATHVLTKAKPKAVWSRRLRCMQVSLCSWSVNCCVQACKQTQRDTQRTKRAKCAHVGDTNNRVVGWIDGWLFRWLNGWVVRLGRVDGLTAA